MLAATCSNSSTHTHTHTHTYTVILLVVIQGCVAGFEPLGPLPGAGYSSTGYDCTSLFGSTAGFEPWLCEYAWRGNTHCTTWATLLVVVLMSGVLAVRNS